MTAETSDIRSANGATRRRVLAGLAASAAAAPVLTGVANDAAASAEASPTSPADVVRPDALHEIVMWSAAELSIAIRRRRVSCVEVMRAYLDHIEAVNPAVNAIVSLRPRSELIAEARAKDDLLRRNRWQGWMHGFPYAVKDSADVTGLQTSYGLVPPEWGFPAAETDSLFVARIRAAGAIFIGKTNLPQLGLGSQTYNDVLGTTLNADDQTKTAGGSSGGAAVAVAMRMLPVADGSDFMGSLRNPPGWNNVFGLRPSYGRVPNGAGELALDQGSTVGPIARTAQDLALLLRTISGYDPGSPLSNRQSPNSLTQLQPKTLRGRKVAWLGDLGGYLPMEKKVLTVTTRALRHFKKLGMSVTSLDGLPRTARWNGNEDLWPTWLTYRHWLAGMSVKTAVDLGLKDALKPEALYEYDGLVGDTDGGPISAVDAYQMTEKRGGFYEAMRGLFDHYDYLVLPTAQVMPFDARLHWPEQVAGTPMSSYHRWMEVTTIGTMINAPVLAVPAGFSDSGLPIGLQVLGRNHDDYSLMDLAAGWEGVTGLVERRLPPLLDS